MLIERKTIIAVIGAGEPSEEEASLAEKVGREIARRGAVLVCGGLGGVMEAACRGASSEGGLTIGILPGESASAANPYVQIPVVTGMREARNVIVVKTARAVIAIGGAYGTLSEIAHALQNGIPVIGLSTWSVSREDIPDSNIITAAGPGEAVIKALALGGNK
jgi:uncharacterized protein (TIGR00725 family)